MAEGADPTTTTVRGIDFADDEIDLGEYIATLIEAKWLIGAITGSVFFFAMAYAFLAAPVYRADALLQVEQSSSSMGALDDLTSMFTGETPAEAEIEILRSRSVVGATVDQLKLDVEVQPHYFPLIGSLFARSHDVKEGATTPFLGLDSFAWGGEQVRIERLDLPRRLEEEELTLEAGGQGRFLLFGPDGEILLEGAVGKPASAESEYGPVAAFVSQLEANPGACFDVTKYSRWSVVRDLQEQLKIAEKGKKTGILEVSLEGKDPEQIAATVEAVTNIYLRQNVERRSEEAEKTLAFLNDQLPTLKANLQGAEARLNEYQSRLGSIDLNLETQAVLEQLADIEKKHSELELKRKELSEKFTGNHPVMLTLTQQQKQLQSDKASLEGQIREMPEEVQESVRLTRDVQVANELYLLLLNKAQEMNVIKAGTIGNVRILDQAIVPVEPIKPKKGLVAALGLVLGGMLGVVVAFVGRALNRGVEDPDLIEQQLGMPIYASVPHSDVQARFARERKKKGSYQSLLSLSDKDDLSVESLRSLRTSLQFALMDASNNVVSITGPSPGIGKSFISANLAEILAEGEKRTLLIDADMRKGHLHEYFGMKRTFGLSGVISGEVPLEQSIHETTNGSLHFLPCGIVPPNPAELLMSERFQQLLDTLAEQYDLVVIDTPPILAVSDAAIIGRMCGINFVVVKSGLHPMREIEHTIKRLRQNGVKPQGLILNDVPLRTSSYGGRFGQYGYHYQYSYK